MEWRCWCDSLLIRHWLVKKKKRKRNRRLFISVNLVCFFARNISLSEVMFPTWRSWHQLYHQPRNRASWFYFYTKKLFWTRGSPACFRVWQITRYKNGGLKYFSRLLTKPLIMPMRNCAASNPSSVRPVGWQGCLKTTATPLENKSPAVNSFPRKDFRFFFKRWEIFLWLPSGLTLGAVYRGQLELGETMCRTIMCYHCNSQWQFASWLRMDSSEVWIFESKRHGRSGYSCFRLGRGDYCRVAAVQRCGADMFSVQPGDPQAGTGSFYSQLDVLQPVAKCIQYATNSDWAHHHGPPRRQRLLSNSGVSRHFSLHKLHAQHGSSQHR